MAKDKKETKKEEGAQDTNAPLILGAARLYQWGAVANHLAGEDGQLALQGAHRFYQETGAMQYEEIGILLREAQRGVNKGYIGNPVIQEAMQMYAKKFTEVYTLLTCGEALELAKSQGAKTTPNIEAAIEPYLGTKVGDIKDDKIKAIVGAYQNAIVTVEGPHDLRRIQMLGELERKLAEEPKKEGKDGGNGDNHYDNGGDKGEDQSEDEEEHKHEDKKGGKGKRDHKGGKSKKH